MSRQIFNPYLPLDTYIPDGEPHVFGDRLYLFGSHDKEGGEAFCMLPYEGWSAPVDDLTAWRCEGTIYRPEQDPNYGPANRYLYAPDVVQGPDGRYYLYYAMSGEGCFTGPIHVAVCDTPAGQYEYYGAVRTPDGAELERYITFDPAVFNDEGKIWLYYGWSLEKAGITENIPQENLIPVEMALFGKTEESIRACPYELMGANAVQLAEDMLTVLGEPNRIVPGQFASFGTSFAGRSAASEVPPDGKDHAFFEASSMRKIGKIYYFIYSSQNQHELCYATSAFPDRGFTYGGVLISNGDIGYQGRSAEERLATTGNNHGSLVAVNGQWYIFYHRQTHKTSFSRQGCAEPVTILPDGSIPQVEMTSCGLNGGPLAGEGVYPASICCNLTNGRMPHQTGEPIRTPLPHVTHRDGERFLAEIEDGTLIGYKYFSLSGKTALTLQIRGEGTGRFEVLAEEQPLGSVSVVPSADWAEAGAVIEVSGTHALYLRYCGTGAVELKQLRLSAR
ncbi:MAG: family 43 glycosylhydrolase [Clostridiales bacterium]|nr:family 43 glycosylhydrolase [Clostridiales bacterium]